MVSNCREIILTDINDLSVHKIFQDKPERLSSELQDLKTQYDKIMEEVEKVEYSSEGSTRASQQAEVATQLDLAEKLRTEFDTLLLKDSQFRIIFTTASGTGDVRLADELFSHVFVDEAGQATTTEVMLTATKLRTEGPCTLVLAGDKLQLPAISFGHNSASDLYVVTPLDKKLS